MKIKLIVAIALILSIFVALSNSIAQPTISVVETARTIVKAIIDGNEKKVGELYDPNMGFFISDMKNFYPILADTNISDYKFLKVLDKNIAFITRSDGKPITFKDDFSGKLINKPGFVIKMIRIGKKFKWQRMGWLDEK